MSLASGAAGISQESDMTASKKQDGVSRRRLLTGAGAAGAGLAIGSVGSIPGASAATAAARRLRQAWAGASGRAG